MDKGLKTVATLTARPIGHGRRGFSALVPPLVTFAWGTHLWQSSLYRDTSKREYPLERSTAWVAIPAGSRASTTPGRKATSLVSAPARCAGAASSLSF